MRRDVRRASNIEKITRRNAPDDLTGDDGDGGDYPRRDRRRSVGVHPPRPDPRDPRDPSGTVLHLGEAAAAASASFHDPRGQPWPEEAPPTPRRERGASFHDREGQPWPEVAPPTQRRERSFHEGRMTSTEQRRSMSHGMLQKAAAALPKSPTKSKTEWLRRRSWTTKPPPLPPPMPPPLPPPMPPPLPPGLITLRIAGLGHHFELDIPPTSTLANLKTEIERRTDVPPPYQRLVAKQKRLVDDAKVLGPTILDGSAVRDIGIGIEHRTKLLLLRSEAYERDRPGIESLDGLFERISDIESGRRAGTMEENLAKELVTQICCGIDAVETNGSEPLRAMRKRAIRAAEGVETKMDESRKRDVDESRRRDVIEDAGRQIDDVDAKMRRNDLDSKTVDELVTQICCKLDNVDVSGSEELRALRKGMIRRAEDVSRRSEEMKRGIDP